MKAKRIITYILTMVLVSAMIFSYNMFSSYANDEISAEDFASSLETFSEANWCYSTTEVTPSENSNEAERKLNRLLVSTNSNDSLENYCGAVDALEGFNNWHLLQFDCEDAAEEAYLYYSEQDYVNYVEYEEIIKLEDVTDTIEMESPLNWGATFTGSDKCIEYLKNNNINLSTVVVAVVDTGVDATHSFFIDDYGESRILPPIRKNDNVPYSDHGTKMTGIIVDNTPSNVKIQSFNYFYYRANKGETIYGSDFTLSVEIDRAVEAGVDVINLSLAGAGRNAKVEEAIASAIEKGIVVVASAGNENNDANYYYPANVTSAITVSAINQDLTGWYKNQKEASNYGSVVDISAPGSALNTTGISNTYENTSATSPATAFVSAAASILKSINPIMSVEEITNIILETAYVPEGWDTENWGVGIVNFMNMVSYERSATPKIQFNANGKAIITTSSPDTKIYYTTNGSDPIIGESTLYKKAFNAVNASEIKAIAYTKGLLPSKIASHQMKFQKNDVNIYYKEYMQLNIPDTYDVIGIYSTNEDVVTVNKTGEIYGVHTGEADVVVTLKNGYKYIYPITVEYAFWQKFVIYFLFGFIWYI